MNKQYYKALHVIAADVSLLSSLPQQQSVHRPQAPPGSHVSREPVPCSSTRPSQSPPAVAEEEPLVQLYSHALRKTGNREKLVGISDEDDGSGFTKINFTIPFVQVS